MGEIILRKSSNFLLILFFILSISLSQVASADIISVNSGGGGEFVLTTDKYIEGFFFGIPKEAEAPPEVPPEGPGGGGGAPSVSILVEPTRLDEDLVVNTAISRIIKVTNLKTSGSATVNVRQENLDGIVTLGATSLTIQPSQTVELGVFFEAPDEPDVYTGKIIIGNKEVLVTLNVREGELLFDSNIAVLNENFEVPQEGTLKTLVTLIPLGDPARLDITLDFTVKDYAGQIYLTKSETLLVEEQMELNRNFDIGNLPLGEYVIALELVYPNGVAPSSAHFKVIEQPSVIIIGKFILFLIILILLIAIAIIIILIARKLREKKKQGQPGQAT
jgi:hypothetical protein